MESPWENARPKILRNLAGLMPERRETLAPLGERSGRKTTLATISRLNLPMPERSSKKKGDSLKKSFLAVAGVPGPSRQQYLVSPANTQGQELDGISALPPTSTSRQAVRRSLRKSIAQAKTSSDTKSRIPTLNLQTAKSVIPVPASRKRLNMNAAKSIENRKRPTFNPARKGATPALSASKRLSKISSAVKTKSRVAALARQSTSLLNSTALFEVNELAALSSTPRPPVTQNNLEGTTSTNADVLSMLSDFKRELMAQQNRLHEEVISRQNNMYEEVMKVLKNETDLQNEQKERLDRLESLLKPLASRLNEGSSNVNDGMAASNSADNSENLSGRKKKTPGVPLRAMTQYENIRKDFHCLSLRTPKRNRASDVALSPKTPKSVLSRTLQHQLGDLFEES